jgi:actin-related protein
LIDLKTSTKYLRKILIFYFRIFEQIPSFLDIEKVEVLTNRKEIDSRFLSWKGGSILSALEIMKDLWIKSSEWKLNGIRSIKEKALFEFS